MKEITLIIRLLHFIRTNLQLPNNSPITYDMQYHAKRTIGANWSQTAKFVDNSTMYVIKYSEYAPSIDKFIEMYPTFTIDAIGLANSKETIDEVGYGDFGNRPFQTTLFKGTDFIRRLLVSSYKKDIMFEAEAQMGIELKSDDHKLYLIPFVNGRIYSVGARWRKLNLNFNFNRITFVPKRN